MLEKQAYAVAGSIKWYNLMENILEYLSSHKMYMYFDTTIPNLQIYVTNIHLF